MSRELEVLVSDEGNLLARSGNLVIQVRTGEMTASVLDRFESAARLIRAQTRDPVGGIAIIEDGARLAPPELRSRQTALVRSLLADKRTYMTSVLMGTSVGTRTLRAAMRLALMGIPRLHTASSPAEGATWLAARLGTHDAEAILELVERARALARAPT